MPITDIILMQIVSLLRQVIVGSMMVLLDGFLQKDGITYLIELLIASNTSNCV